MSVDLSDQLEEFRTWLLERHRLRYEITLIALLWLGSFLTVAGTVTSVLASFLTDFHPALIFRWGVWAAGAGIALTTIAALMSRPIDRLRRYKAEERSGSRYERRRNWTQLKTGSILLNLLAAVAAVELLLALLSVFGTEPIHLPAGLSIERVTLLLMLAMGAVIAHVHRVALEIERPERSMGLETAFFALGIGGAFVFTGLSTVITRGGVSLPILGELVPGHATLFSLAGLTAATSSLFLSRHLPTVRALYLEEREFQTADYVSRQKSVVMPTMIAFALLFLVLLLTFIFELSVVGEFSALVQNAVLIGAFGFIVLALLISVVVSWSLAQSEDKTTLYQRLRTVEERTELTVLGLSAGLGLLFLVATVSVATGRGVFGIAVDPSHWVDTLGLGILATLGPYGFYYAAEQRRIRSLEERFPDFLRDVAASRKAGLTLTNAIKITAKGEYGALTPDIEKMADQLSWNVSFEEALERFGDRVDTPLVQRATTLIIEASRSGGHVIDVLDAAATDAREIKTLENERRLTMTLYTVVIYIAFFVFLGVAAVLYGQFIPEVLASTQDVAGQGGVGSQASGAIGNIGTSDLVLSDYRTFFFIASISQGIGNGILAGLMETGKALNGLRHAFWMTAVTLVVFAFFLG